LFNIAGSSNRKTSRFALTFALSASACCLGVAWGQSAPAPKAAPGAKTAPAPSVARIDLKKGWFIQSSAKASQTGAEIATAVFQPGGWIAATVPTTVIAAQVASGLYADPYFGENLALIPGTPTGRGQNAATPPNSPYAVPWWYRTTFTIPAADKGKRLWLNFDAINYKADIWLNGRQIGKSDDVIGMYRMFEFDITDVAVPGVNSLAVEVTPPTNANSEFTITFVDWNPMPADRDMGLVRDVYIRTSGPVALRNTQVVTKVDNPPAKAHLTLYADLKNGSDKPVEGALKGTIGSIAVSKQVSLAPHESKQVAFTPEDNPALNIANPKLWWPYGLGPQNLNTLHMEFVAGGAVSDKEDVQFGIREVTGVNDAQGHRLFTINGKKILIRGGGWSPDMMMRYDDQREENEIRLARDMNLNTIRLEGKMMNEHFFNTADKLGMLVMPGWCCCSYWERWQNWTPKDYEIASASLRDQLRRLRNHPSVYVFLYGSDNSPSARPEAAYLQVLNEDHWPNPTVSSAADRTTTVGKTGVKMTGPYEYVLPSYWEVDTKAGGAFGYNTETSPGPAVPVLESIKEMLPKEHWWPVDDWWNFHAGRGSYGNLNVFTAALNARYGKATGLEDFVTKSQMQQYEGERAMFEAFGRNKYTSTGVIQWMLNNAWPMTIWHLYDWYLRPGGGYFGTKIANERLHVQYSYDDQSVAVVNSYYRSFAGYKATAKVYNLDLTEKFSKTAPVEIGEDSSTKVFVIPPIDGLSKTYFVKLTLQDAAGKTVSSNFYWLSTQQDVSNFARGNGVYTPASQFADYTALQDLPPAKVTVSVNSEVKGAEHVDHVTLENTSSKLAFFLHLTVLKGKDGGDVKPIFWDDNYVSLMPGEKREVTATYDNKLLRGAAPTIRVDAPNQPEAK
jgi:exo-1,4-beta-D-glucosaminidase